MYPLASAVGRRDAGAKAERLAQARAAGLTVPDGFVVPPGDEVDAGELDDQLARLGGERFAVRSSADVEDRAGASAAGVFVSVVPVERTGVAEAIARVRASVRGAPAMAYLGARDLGRATMAVLVQPYVAARRLGVLHTAPVLDGALWAEEREPQQPEWGEVMPRAVPVDDRLARGARRLAELVGGEVDVEYALTDEGIVFLQVRPLSAAPLGHEPTLWVAALEAALGGATRAAGRWVRDAEHNPEPLSTAQASLVAFLDGLPGIPRQLVLHGYLYVAAAAIEAPREDDGDGDGDGDADLAAIWSQRIEPSGDARLAALEQAGMEPLPVEVALDAFSTIARASMVELSPLLRAARRRLDAFLRRALDEALAAHGALLAGTGGHTLARDAALWALGRMVMAADAGDDGGAVRVMLARYEERFGAYAPAWDVAIAPDDEQPARVLAMARLVARGPSPEVRHEEAMAAAAMAQRRVIDRLAPPARAQLVRLVDAARVAQSLGEADDALFFRAQRLVRRSLRALGGALAASGRLADPNLVFDATLDEARAGDLDEALLRSRRARRQAASRLAPPSSIDAGVPRWRSLAARGATQEAGARYSTGVIVGAGTAGRAWGRVFLLVDPVHPPAALPPGAVLVVAAILPSLTYLIPGAAALVTDYGGALSHAATLAREYGVPAVLGTGGATAALVDGEELLVDGDAGKIYRLGGRP